MCCVYISRHIVICSVMAPEAVSCLIFYIPVLLCLCFDVSIFFAPPYLLSLLFLSHVSWLVSSLLPPRCHWLLYEVIFQVLSSFFYGFTLVFSPIFIYFLSKFIALFFGFYMYFIYLCPVFFFFLMNFSLIWAFM